MDNSNSLRTQNLPFSFHSIRNISCPEDKENNRTVLVGKAPLASIIGIPTDENVRDYLLEAEGRKRRRPSQVHLAIKDTLKNNPEDFSVLNGGITIVAKGYHIDESKRQVVLFKPSIINGSQTQGVIKDFLSECTEQGEPFPNAHITFEVLVTENDELVAETSIARNFQNDVMTISIAGRLGQLKELSTALEEQRPGSRLQMSETQLSDDYEKTERILQVITALTPAELWLPRVKDGEMPNKVFAYSAKAKCLKLFQDIHEKALKTDDPENLEYRELYQFYLDIVGQAVELHEKWKSHSGFKGTQLKTGFKRDARNNIIEVPDGIVFPVLAALSAFAKKVNGTWRIVPPANFKDDDLITAVKSAFMDMAQSNPQTMGKSKACYAHLFQITSLYRKLSS
jgi:hypothetical protein